MNLEKLPRNTTLPDESAWSQFWVRFKNFLFLRRCVHRELKILGETNRGTSLCHCPRCGDTYEYPEG